MGKIVVKKMMTVALAAVLVFNAAALSYAATSDSNIVSRTIQTADYSSDDLITEPHEAAKSFVEHINYARVALALKNGDLAKQHIDKARKMSDLITNAKVEEQKMTDVETGKLAYQYDTTHIYHYFPIRTGRVEVKRVSDNAPIWARPTLAVTDAEIVYLTLDLTKNKADKFLTAAAANVAKADFKAADDDLSRLADAVITLDTQATVPIDKARDNIALAYNFINAGNFNGAHFAMNHADDALAVMQDSDLYKSHRLEVIAMREDFKKLEKIIIKNDPSMREEIDAKLSKWWSALDDWTINN